MDKSRQEWDRRVEMVGTKTEEIRKHYLELNGLDNKEEAAAMSSFYQGLNLAYSLLKDKIDI